MTARAARAPAQEPTAFWPTFAQLARRSRTVTSSWVSSALAPRAQPSRAHVHHGTLLCMLPFAVIVYLGEIPLMITGAFLSAACVFELFRGFESMDIHPSKPVAYGALVLLYVLHIAFPLSHEYITGWLVFSVMVSCMSMFKIEKHKLEDALSTIFGIIYVEFFSFHIVMSDMTEYGILVWMVLIVAFASDIGAYFTGYFFGKHKLCPKLSPKKTIEGAVGGVIFTVLVSGLFGALFAPDIVIHCILIGIIGSPLSM